MYFCKITTGLKKHFADNIISTKQANSNKGHKYFDSTATTTASICS